MKILRKSMAGLISAGTILCACPQIYAKTESSGQRILNMAKAVGKYMAPVGTALVMGLIGGAGYGKYQDHRMRRNRDCCFACGRVGFIQNVFNIRCLDDIRSDGNGKLNDATVIFLYQAITSNEERMYERVNFNRGDEVLFVGEFEGYRVDPKEFIKIIEHIINGGKVVFLGNMVSETDVSLECILSILELKYKFPSNVLILTNNNERELLRNNGASITKDKNYHILDDTLNNIRNLLCRLIEYTPNCANISDNIYCGIVHDRNLFHSKNKKIFTLNENIERAINSNVISLDDGWESICMSKLTIGEENGGVK